MTPLTIVRLQIQVDPLKIGKAPNRYYDPAALQSVPQLALSPDGSFGVTESGERIIDVHHREHPATRDAKGRAGVTVMGTGDYAVLRERFGEHLVDGIAGESILVDAPEGLAGRDLPPTATLQLATGNLVLHDVRVADPCIEFTRFCLRRDPFDEVDQALRDTLESLGGGARGYRAIASGPGLVSLGDTLLFE